MVERSSKPSSIPITPLAPTPLVALSDDNSRVIASLPAGDRVEVLLHGATVISWKSSNGKENLFLSDKAVLDGSKPVRGGIPIVFPSFGPPESSHETGKLPQHGFARSTRWEYLGKSSEESGRVPGTGGDASVKLDFGLSDSMLDEAMRAKWNHSFGLTYSVTLSSGELQTSMLIRNEGETAWEFKTLLHTYLRIEDIQKTSVTGLQSTPFINKVPSAQKSAASESPITFSGETDRVYTNATSPNLTTTVLEKDRRSLEVRREQAGFTDVVVWNPWSEKAGGMADFGPADGWKHMLCVEVGCVAEWIKLEGGDGWEGGQRLKSVSGGDDEEEEEE